MSTDQADAEAMTASPAGPARRVAVITLALVALLAIGIDLLAKQLVLTNIGDGHAVRLLGGALYLDLTRNSGAAFSIGTQVTVIFPLIAIGVIAFILWYARRLRSVPWAIAFGLVLGGAAGNLVDRVFRAPAPLRGHVIDFISVFGPYGERFPIFNLADSALFCGVVLAILLEFTGWRRDGTRVVSADRQT
jgi:signal peptidase II